MKSMNHRYFTKPTIYMRLIALFRARLSHGSLKVMRAEFSAREALSVTSCGVLKISSIMAYFYNQVALNAGL